MAMITTLITVTAMRMIQTSCIGGKNNMQSSIDDMTDGIDASSDKLVTQSSRKWPTKMTCWLRLDLRKRILNFSNLAIKLFI